MSNRLNIGLIGSGFTGQTHADSYPRAGILDKNLPRTPVLYAIADRSGELAEQARGRLGFQNAYAKHYREII
jgi:predicted dehydrogenase